MFYQTQTKIQKLRILNKRLRQRSFPKTFATFLMTWFLWSISNRLLLKNTYREKAPANKNASLSKKYEHGLLGDWHINQFFIWDFLTETEFPKNTVVTDKTSFFVVVLFRARHSICLNSLSANSTKWPNTLKQFVSQLPTNCLRLFDHFVGLALKGLTLAYDSVVLHRNVAFSILVFSTKK